MVTNHGKKHSVQLFCALEAVQTLLLSLQGGNSGSHAALKPSDTLLTHLSDYVHFLLELFYFSVDSDSMRTASVLKPGDPLPHKEPPGLHSILFHACNQHLKSPFEALEVSPRCADVLP